MEAPGQLPSLPPPHLKSGPVNDSECTATPLCCVVCSAVNQASMYCGVYMYVCVCVCVVTV